MNNQRACEICTNKRNNPYWYPYMYRCVLKDFLGRPLRPSDNRKNDCKLFKEIEIE